MPVDTRTLKEGVALGNECKVPGSASGMGIPVRFAEITYPKV